MAPLALVVAAGALAVVVLTGLTAGHDDRRAAVVHVQLARTPPKHGAAAAPSPPVAQVPPTPVSPALATELEAQGHEMLQSSPAGAVPVLQRAVRATGENVSACLEPASQVCLTYAYALYDLGRALRLSGHPSAAVPILERRLQIDNQRSTVEVELELARQQVG